MTKLFVSQIVMNTKLFVCDTKGKEIVCFPILYIMDEQKLCFAYLIVEKFVCFYFSCKKIV